MATRQQVSCINKTDRMNPHERITHIGGRNANGTSWKLKQEEAIAAIEQRKYEFFDTMNFRRATRQSDSAGARGVARVVEGDRLSPARRRSGHAGAQARA